MISELEKFWRNVSNGGAGGKKTTAGKCELHMGTVGWDEVDEHAFIGSDAEDGHTFVRVTLYTGRDFSDEHKPDVAQGHQILCNIGSSLYYVPPKGTRCVVAIPEGMEHLPGAGVIIETVSQSPPDQFGKNRVKMDFGEDYDLVIKARSVTITDYSDNYLAVSPDMGVRAADGDGNLLQVQGGITGLASSKINLVIGATGLPALAGLYLGSTSAAMTAGLTMVKLNGLTQMGTWISASIALAAGNIGLGTGASPATPVCIFPKLPSTTVFVQQ